MPSAVSKEGNKIDLKPLPDGDWEMAMTMLEGKGLKQRLNLAWKIISGKFLVGKCMLSGQQMQDFAKTILLTQHNQGTNNENKWRDKWNKTEPQQ